MGFSSVIPPGVNWVLLMQTLEPIGFEVRGAENGRVAINHAMRWQPDLILMDMQMPEMDGYEATRKIREFNKDVIIIAQTAYALPGDREKALEAGCNDYIPKPIAKENLFEIINKYFPKEEKKKIN